MYCRTSSKQSTFVHCWLYYYLFIYYFVYLYFYFAYPCFDLCIIFIIVDALTVGLFGLGLVILNCILCFCCSKTIGEFGMACLCVFALWRCCYKYIINIIWSYNVIIQSKWNNMKITQTMEQYTQSNNCISIIS